MFLDDVVLAGVLTVGLMLAFFGGFGYIAYKAMKKRQE
ncbi:cytochrome c oxidase subunit CcoM [Marinomonas phaeophyticola]|nr:cytochrome c oxidase subunit CcoM [Marinomonas sp. 15G1-11]